MSFFRRLSLLHNYEHLSQRSLCSLGTDLWKMYLKIKIIPQFHRHFQNKWQNSTWAEELFQNNNYMHRDIAVTNARTSSNQTQVKRSTFSCLAPGIRNTWEYICPWVKRSDKKHYAQIYNSAQFKLIWELSLSK